MNTSTARVIEVEPFVWHLRVGGHRLKTGPRMHCVAESKARGYGWPFHFPMVTVPDRPPVGIA